MTHSGNHNQSRNLRYGSKLSLPPEKELDEEHFGLVALSCQGDDLKSMWEKLQDFDLEFQVKACDVASLSDVQERGLGNGRLRSGVMSGIFHVALRLCGFEHHLQLPW